MATNSTCWTYIVLYQARAPIIPGLELPSGGLRMRASPRLPCATSLEALGGWM